MENNTQCIRNGFLELIRSVGQEKIKYNVDQLYEIYQELQKTQYSVCGFLGSGAEGPIFTATKNGTKRAVKVLSAGDASKIDNQIKIMEKLRNKPYILQIFDAFYSENKKYFFYVTENLTCDLQTILAKMKEKNSQFSFQQTVSFAIQMVIALQTLEAENIIHSDLKPANILYDKTNQCFKISDYGFSKIILPKLEQSAATKDLNGCTLKYAAPEIWKQTKDYTCKVDIYSLGLIIHELISGEILNNYQAMLFVTGNNNYSNEVIRQMLVVDRKNRASLQVLLNNLIKLQKSNNQNHPNLPVSQQQSIKISLDCQDSERKINYGVEGLGQSSYNNFFQKNASNYPINNIKQQVPQRYNYLQQQPRMTNVCKDTDRNNNFGVGYGQPSLNNNYSQQNTSYLPINNKRQNYTSSLPISSVRQIVTQNQLPQNVMDIERSEQPPRQPNVPKEKNSPLTTFLESHLAKYDEYQTLKDQLVGIGQKIFQIKEKKIGEQGELDSLLKQFENYIEDNFENIKRQDRQFIIQQMAVFQVPCPEKILFENICLALFGKKVNPISEVKQLSSQIFVSDFFEKAKQNSQLLINRIIPKLSIKDILNIETQSEENTLNQIKFIFGIYPFLKSWLFLRRSLTEFMKNVASFLEFQFPIIKSLSSSDLMILLYEILPETEVRILGECLANTYTPFPFIYKLSNNKGFKVFNNLAFYQLSEKQKSLITYINLNNIKENDSIQFCNRLLSLEQGNGFENCNPEKSLSSNQIISMISKIHHQFGVKFAFVKISQLDKDQLEKSDSTKQLTNQLISQSKALIIHTTQSEIQEYFEKRVDNSLGAILSLVKNNNAEMKILMIINSQIGDSFQQISKIQSKSPILIKNAESQCKELWEFLSINKNEALRAFDLSSFKFSKGQHKLKEKQIAQIIQIIQGIEQSSNPLLSLNVLQKQIMDCKTEDVKLKINFSQSQSKELREKNSLQQVQLENQLKKNNLNGKVFSLLEFTLVKDNNSQNYRISQQRVFQLKQIIQQTRGRYQDQYEEKYVEIQSLIQMQEQKLYELQEAQRQTPGKEFNVKIEELSRKILDGRDKILKLDRDHQRKEITFDMIANEISIAIEHTPQEIQNKNSNLQMALSNFFLRSYQNSLPLQLIEGNTLQFGNAFLRQMINEIKDKNITVVSVVGLQSSAKSTLMNYTFQTNFSVGNGKVTKGLYFTKITLEDGLPIIIIDSEGLMSLVGRDQQYDNSIMAFIFLISNIVIFNQKGEANKQVKDLLELCGHIISTMMESRSLPSVVFALRDSNDVENMQNINQQALQIIGNIKIENTSSCMKLDKDNIILFPPAFNEQQKEGIHLKQSNQIFSNQILKLRQFIYKAVKENTEKYQDFRAFYEYGEKTWRALRGNCSDLIVASTLKNYLDQENLKVECGVEVQNQIRNIFRNAEDQISQLRLNPESEDLNSQVKQICNEFSNYLNLQTESAKQEVTQFTYECFKRNKLVDKNILENQILINASEFERNVDILKSGAETQLLQMKTEIEINKENQNIDSVILSVFQDIKANNISKQQQVENIKQKFEEIVQRSTEILEKKHAEKQSLLDINLYKAWQDTLKKLALQYEEKHTLKDIYSTFNPHQDKVDLAPKILQDCGQLDKIRKYVVQNASSQTLVNQITEEAQKKTFDQVFPMIDQMLNTLQNKEENWSDVLQKLGELSYQNIEMTLKQNNIKQDKSFNSFVKGFIKNALINGLQYALNQKRDINEREIKQQKNNLTERVKKSIVTQEQVLNCAGQADDLGNACSQKIIELVIQKFQQEVFTKIQVVITKLLSNIENPEKENQKAFAKCFDGKEINPYYLIKFYLNTPQFIIECIKRDMEKLRTAKEVELLTTLITQFQNVRTELIQVLETMQAQIAKQYQFNFRFQFSQLLQKYINNTPEITRSIEVFLHASYNQPFTWFKVFLGGVIEGIKQSQRLDEFAKNSASTKFNQEMEKQFQLSAQKAIGCCHVCPYCGAKCTLYYNHLGNHDSKQTHRFIAYAGCSYKDTRTFTTIDCQSAIKKTWYSGDKQYKDMHELNKEKYPNWTKHFQRLEFESKSTFYDPIVQKRAYVLIGEWFGNHFNQKYQTPKKVVIPDKWRLYLTEEEQKIKIPVDLKFYENQF